MQGRPVARGPGALGARPLDQVGACLAHACTTLGAVSFSPAPIELLVPVCKKATALIDGSRSASPRNGAAGLDPNLSEPDDESGRTRSGSGHVATKRRVEALGWPRR